MFAKVPSGLRQVNVFFLSCAHPVAWYDDRQLIRLVNARQRTAYFTVNNCANSISCVRLRGGALMDNTRCLTDLPDRATTEMNSSRTLDDTVADERS